MSGQVLRSAASMFPKMIVGSSTMEIGSAFDVSAFILSIVISVTLSSMERMLCSPAEIDMPENHPLKKYPSVKA